MRMTVGDDDLLGGAARTRTRVRGFKAWSPQPDTRALLEQVRRVLTEYTAYLPLTLRQIFYRLVGAHQFEKSEQAYERLGEHIVRARRARLIPMDAIRDDGGTIIRPIAWDSAEDFLQAVRGDASRFALDRTVGQKTRLAVICEAVGMVPQLARVAEPYGIAVMSSGGFDSVTEKHRFAAESTVDERPTEVLHIGDHDPSGAHMFLAYLEDVEAFTRDLGGTATFTWLAVTPQQIAQYDLPTAPAKATDRRDFAGQTCQAEALAPDTLAEILYGAIADRINRSALDRVLLRERAVRRELARRLAP
jgi:hypothetical protein